jgi:hypothetical protein
MAAARELTGLYENFMLSPRRGPAVCETCFNLTTGYDRCYACAHVGGALAAMVPISYSVAGEQLNRALACYKRIDGVIARRLGIELAAVLWRFLDAHEQCLATAAETRTFQLVTTVPSGDASRDEHHPLHWIVGELVGPTRDRYERVLRRSAYQTPARAFSPRKYLATRMLEGQSVLLIDDTWTTGANAHSAAAALYEAGSGTVAAAVIGRHINRSWGENDRRLNAQSRFDWNTCALCARKATDP